MNRSVVVALGILMGGLFLVGGYSLFTTYAPVSREAATAMIPNTSVEPDGEALIASTYAPLIPLTLGGVELQASVAETIAQREQGLSSTPYLPAGVVKLFIFDESWPYSFWMKDMLYPIDIIWLDDEKMIVHIEHRVTPDTYPQSFTPPTAATYVIETNAGFAKAQGLATGTKASW
jgi:uncharacterized membrane protein (UPF0127 family)